MFSILRNSLPLFAALLSLPLGGAVFARQDAKAGAGPEDQLIATIEDSLKDARSTTADKREAAEEKIRSTTDQLLTNFKSYSAEKQKLIVAEMGKILANRTPDDKNATYNVAAAALSDMGPDAVPVLLKSMPLKHLEKRIEVQKFLVAALGKHKDEKQIEFFIKLLQKSETDIVVAAIGALGEYRECDAKIRKHIAEALVREYARTQTAEDAAKGKDEVMHKRLLAIEVPMNTSLEMVTLQRFQTEPEWEKWFNENRNKNW
jgi:HEAT repeat protein